MELFDLYDAARRPTGRTMVRGDAVPDGLYRLVIHVCVFNSRGEMLIQQRQTCKKSWPGMWDVSVGGCVTAGEDSRQGACRELREELGLEADFEHLATAITTTFTGGFDDFFVLHTDLDPAGLKLQASEVRAAKWACRDEVMTLLERGQFIPYHKGLMEYIFFRADHNGDFDIKE